MPGVKCKALSVVQRSGSCAMKELTLPIDSEIDVSVNRTGIQRHLKRFGGPID